MMKKMTIVWICMLAALCGSCDKELVEYRAGDIRVCVEKGEGYLHDFPLWLGIKRKNAPQMAIWIEDMEGRYLSTVYVTHRIATQSWLASGGNRRREALPHWCHSRGVQYADGLYLPTKDEPLADGISGATPRGSYDVKLTPLRELRRFTIKIEVNHSTDFNDAYPESAAEGEPGWSGGEGGSGQPALVYAADVNLDAEKKVFPAVLAGHSSADGSDGTLSADMSGLSTALHIVDRITISVEP